MRRLHLYAGLFLLPWVFLYGITGAMFNHLDLLPAGKIHDVPPQALSNSSIHQFPPPDTLAQQVVAKLQKAAPGKTISLNKNHGAADNNSVVLEAQVAGQKHHVHINPVNKSA